MLKFEGVATVGDIIRAYDFRPCAGRDDAFIEGVVLDAKNFELGHATFKIKVTADKFVGDVETEEFEGNRVGKIMFVPHEIGFFDFDFRVVNLTTI